MYAPSFPYHAHFDAESDVLRPQNTYFGNIYDEELTSQFGPTPADPPAANNRHPNRTDVSKKGRAD